MRIKITARGIYGADGEIEVGTEIALKDEPPLGWAGRYEVLKANPAKDAQPVTNTPIDPLDHDGDGMRGGSKRGAASTAAKGAAKRRAKAATEGEAE